MERGFFYTSQFKRVKVMEDTTLQFMTGAILNLLRFWAGPESWHARTIPAIPHNLSFK